MMTGLISICRSFILKIDIFKQLYYLVYNYYKNLDSNIINNI